MPVETVGIDLGAIQAELDAMTPEQLQAELLQYKTRQKVATAKYSNPENAKKYRQKRSELLKLMQAKAKELGILDKINEQATVNAKAKLAAESAAASGASDELAAFAEDEEAA